MAKSTIFLIFSFSKVRTQKSTIDLRRGPRENVEDLKSGDKMAITPTHLVYDSFQWIFFLKLVFSSNHSTLTSCTNYRFRI